MAQVHTVTELMQRGLDRKNEGDYDAALEAFRAVVAGEPTHYEAHHQIGLVLGFVGDFDASLAALTLASELSPDNIPILLDLGLTYSMLGMTDEAKATFETVLSIDPGNATAQKNLAYF